MDYIDKDEPPIELECIVVNAGQSQSDIRESTEMESDPGECDQYQFNGVTIEDCTDEEESGQS